MPGPMRIVVTGTDTGVGKTVFSAGLIRLLDAAYWKPVQAGLDGETDTEAVRRLSGAAPERLVPETWRLSLPAPPYLAAEHDRVRIDVDALNPPPVNRPLIIEGAGGLMVPLTREVLYIDVFARWGAPVVLCARTTLGTLNHTLLSLEALRRRAIPVIGVALLGAAHADNARTIAEFGRVRVLGRLPHLDPLTPESLASAFTAGFSAGDFTAFTPRA
jgi:dethiobiotin synthetase